MDKKRINFFCTMPVYEDVVAISAKYGLSRPKVVQLAFTAGMSALKLALNPTWESAIEEVGKDLDDLGIKRFIASQK